MNILYCNTCTDDLYKYKPKEWRFACDECAEHHQEYHQGAFPGHVVTVVHKPESTFEALERQLRRGA